MKKSIIVLIISFAILLTACNRQAAQISQKGSTSVPDDTSVVANETPSPTTESGLSSDKLMPFLDPDCFPILVQEEKNYQLYTDSQHSGYYYVIYDNQGYLMDSGFCSWRFLKLGYVGNSLVTLQNNLDNAMFTAKYYDVEHGRVSRTFTKPIGNTDRVVAYFDTDNSGIKLVVRNLFDPDAFFVEFRDESFTVAVYTAQCSAVFPNDESSIQVSYYSGYTGEVLTNRFDFCT